MFTTEPSFIYDWKTKFDILTNFVTICLLKVHKIIFTQVNKFIMIIINVNMEKKPLKVFISDVIDLKQ